MYNIRRGDIYWVGEYGFQVGSEQHPCRPAIIVSNNDNNKHNEIVEIVYCTTQDKTEIPTHVTISSTPKQSTVLCEQIMSIAIERLGDYLGRCTPKEMKAIDKAILISLGIDEPPKEILKIESKPDVCSKCIVLEAERNTYKSMFESLLGKIMKKRPGGKNE